MFYILSSGTPPQRKPLHEASPLEWRVWELLLRLILLSPEVTSYGLIITALIIGGVIGTLIARKIQMTALPQLVAAFSQLGGDLRPSSSPLRALLEPHAFSYWRNRFNCRGKSSLKWDWG